MNWFISQPILIIILGIIISALGTILDKEKPFLRLPMIIFFIGALLNATGGFLSSSKQSGLQNELQQKSDTLLILQGALSRKNDKIIQQGDSLIIKSEKISNLQQQLTDIVTGGNSFCYLRLVKGEAKVNNVFLVVVPVGNEPLYDVNIRICDLEIEIPTKENLTLEETMKSQNIINIGNIGIKQEQLIGSIKWSGITQQRYNVFISTRNGFYTELIRLRLINGNWWRAAYKVTKFDGKKEIKLFEESDPEFPRNEENKIKWD